MFTLNTVLSFLFISCSFFNSSLTFFNFIGLNGEEEIYPLQEKLLCIIPNKQQMISTLMYGSGLVQPTIDPRKRTFEIQEEDGLKTTYTSLGLILHLFRDKKELPVALEKYLSELQILKQNISSKTFMTLGNYGTGSTRYYNTAYLPQEVTVILTKYEQNGTIKTDSEE